MHHSFRMMCVLVAAVMCTLTTTPVSANEPAGPRAGFAPGGHWMALGDDDIRRELDGMAATGATWVRVPFLWANIEPAQGRIEWGRHDRVIRLINERGLRPIALVAYTPGWARPVGCFSQYCAPADAADLGRFVHAAVQRYAPAGVTTWEIWNEPNIAQYFRPMPSVGAYSKLLQAAASAAQQAAPNVTVVTGGLAPAADDPGRAIAPLTFVRELYSAGMRQYFDGVGVHPYSDPYAPSHESPTNLFGMLPEIHRIMSGRGDASKKVWLTEFGWAGGRWGGASSEAERAAFVQEAYETHAAWDWAGPLLWFSYRDIGSNSHDRDHNFGLVGRDFTPKPLLEVFTALMGGSSPSPSGSRGTPPAAEPDTPPDDAAPTDPPSSQPWPLPLDVDLRRPVGSALCGWLASASRGAAAVGVSGIIDIVRLVVCEEGQMPRRIAQ